LGTAQVMEKPGEENWMDEEERRIPPSARGGKKLEAGDGLKTQLDLHHKTKSWCKTRLSELKAAQVEIFVEEGVIENKRSIMSSSHYLSYKVRIP